MNIAFVDNNDKRVLRVNIEEADSVTHLTEAHCAFINLLCDTLNWHWEPMKQPRDNSRVLSYAKLKETFNDSGN